MIASESNVDENVEDAPVRRQLDRKISIMRERFMQLQDIEKETEEADPAVLPSLINPTAVTPKENLAAHRWNKLRKIVRSSAGPFSPANRSRKSPASAEGNEEEDDDVSESSKSKVGMSTKHTAHSVALELEDVQLQEEWKDDNTLTSFQSKALTVPDLVWPEDITLEEQGFLKDSDDLKLQISRIPEDVVTRRKDAIEAVSLAQHHRATQNIRNSQVDVIWRENLARERIKTMEENVRSKQLKERENIIKLALAKERALSRDFHRVREDLEMGIKRQQAAVQEDFGKLLIHEESLSRQFNVYYNMFPQPMEFRIHLCRAMKNKLPKGAYVMMLTQYDRLGGYPLAWSTLGANGIGNMRPGITKIVKHQGRYFDRILRFEDSCFALCPPRPFLKPGFIFILELFQLANFRNPEDHVVAWAALPMSFESMSLIEGKFKLPMLRGEHSAHVQHFRSIERDIARDLDQWLCNVYFEVRQVPLQELGATNEMMRAAKFDMDYFNNIIIPDLEMDQKVVPGGPRGVKRSVLAPSHVLLAEDVPIDQLPPLGVDKGIFRRKVAPTLPQSVGTHGAAAGISAQSNSALDENRSPIFKAGSVDLEAGGVGGGGPGTGGGMGRSFSVGVPSDLDGTANHKKDDSAPVTAARTATGVWGFVNALFHRSAPVAPSSPVGTHRKQPSDAVLRKDESFLEHRKELIKKWKENIRNKVPTASVRDPHGSVLEHQIRERGYNLQDEVFLHKQQRGKLAGVEAIDGFNKRQWAAAGLEGRVVRKWQSDGPRFDSDAIDDGDLLQLSPQASPPHPAKGSGGAFFPEKLPGADEYQWEELRDIREMQEYNMAIAADPTRRKHVMPGAIARSKLRYLSLELFGDLVPFLFGTFEFYSTVFLYGFALWMRIYAHFLAQYLFLLAANTPVYDFSLRVLMIQFKYMSESISTSTEVGVVAVGPIANIILYLFLVVFGHMFYQYSGFLPDVFSKFFAYFGVAVVLDPLLIALVDLGYHNYACASTSDACKSDYTSSDCNCFNGDFVKLWYRMERVEGSGLTGLVITGMLYLGCGVLTLLVLYEYLLNVHRDGRILDLWRRVNGPAEEFFIPDDFEVSAAELQDVINRAKNWKGPEKARRRVYIQEGRESDPFQKNFQKSFKRYVIYECSPDGKTTSVHRQFLLDDDGKILEIFADFRKKDAQQRAFNMKGAFTKALGGEKDKNQSGEEEEGEGGAGNQGSDDGSNDEDEQVEHEDEGVNGNDNADEQEEDNFDVEDEEDREVDDEAARAPAPRAAPASVPSPANRGSPKSKARKTKLSTTKPRQH